MGKVAAEILDHFDHLLTKAAGRSGVSDIDTRQAKWAINESCAHVQIDAEAQRLAVECRSAVNTFMNSRCYTRDLLALTSPIDAEKQTAAQSAYAALRSKLAALPADRATIAMGME